MGDDALDRDARIKLSIGTKDYGRADGQLALPRGLVFDHHRGFLLVADTNNHRVQVFSCDDGDGGGSFVSKFGEKGNQPGQFYLRTPTALSSGPSNGSVNRTYAQRQAPLFNSAQAKWTSASSSHIHFNQ